jgi:hypothetical protein
MTDARAFRGFRFPAEVILWAVRWYLQFPISYRDLERMLADRGVAVDHTTMETGRIRTPFFERCGTATAEQGGNDAAHQEPWRVAVAALAARRLVRTPEGREAYRDRARGRHRSPVRRRRPGEREVELDRQRDPEDVIRRVRRQPD